MSLVITELSNAGISMVADSAITYVGRNGEIKSVDQKGWKKLFKVPSINAGLSYWGTIGKVPTKKRFDEWLKEIIKEEDSYHNLKSFAEYITKKLNEACGNKPLPGNEIGIHISGHAPWKDGEIRPFFYHVHNGHGKYKREGIKKFDRLLQKDRLIRIKWEWVSQPRKLFSVHQDFPRDDKSLKLNLFNLDVGFFTRNGDFLLYVVLWEKLSEALKYMNLMDSISVPRDPNNLNLQTRFLMEMVQTIIRIYKYSSRYRVVGGKVNGLAIFPDRLQEITIRQD